MPEVPSAPSDTRKTRVRNPAGGGDSSTIALPPARLGRSLLSALRSIWDRLGTILLVSLIGTVHLLLSLSLGLLVPHAWPAPLRAVGIGLISVTALSPLIAAAFDVALRICTHREVSFPLVFSGLRQYGSVAIRLGTLHLVVGLTTASNLVFYLQVKGIPGRTAVLICLYLLLFWCTMALYQGPLLVLQESGAFDAADRPAKRGAKAVVRRSFFLVVGEPLFSIGLGIAALLWSVLSLLTAVGAAMCWLGGICILITAPTLALLAKYGVLKAVEAPDAPLTKEA